MLGFLFGFNARLGRWHFFLGSIAVAVLMTAMCAAIAGYAFQHGMPSMTSWPVIAAAVLFGWLTFTLYSMRFRDIGWDPVCVISGWFALEVVDRLVATHIPAVSLGHDHDGTIVGGLAGLALFLALMFWPSGSPEDPAPTSGEPLRMPDNRFRSRDNESATVARIARVANGEFGRRAT
jgi:uncharacterized membrane protein YhaH (DUF805 family)